MTHIPRDLLSRAQLTQAEAARLIGIDERTMRRYHGKDGASATRSMPEPCRRLLALIADVPGVAAYLDRIAAEKA